MYIVGINNRQTIRIYDGGESMCEESIKWCLFEAYGPIFDIGLLACGRLPSTDPHAVVGTPQINLQTLSIIELWKQKRFEYGCINALTNYGRTHWELVREALSCALATYRVEDDELSRMLLEAYDHPRGHQDVASALLGLKQLGVKIAVQSNGYAGSLANSLSDNCFDQLFDAIISVDEESGSSKPARAAYCMIGEIDIRPSETLYLTSDAWDVRGAESAGFNVCWVNRTRAPAEYGSSKRRLEIHDLTGLPALVAQLQAWLPYRTLTKSSGAFWPLTKPNPL